MGFRMLSDPSRPVGYVFAFGLRQLLPRKRQLGIRWEQVFLLFSHVSLSQSGTLWLKHNIAAPVAFGLSTTFRRVNRPAGAEVFFCRGWELGEKHVDICGQMSMVLFKEVFF